jgi:cytochrome c5
MSLNGGRSVRIKKFLVASQIVVLGGTAAGQALAETSVEEAQRLYREHCRHCHDDGSANGEYTPMTLIQAQWERFFKRKYERKHRSVVDEKFGGVPVTEAISPEVLEKIQGFAIDHAADTDQPMTCG